MSEPNISVFIPELFKYNHHLIKAPANSFSGHSHNLYEILYVLSGDASHIIEDKRYKLKSGDLIITRPQKYHFIQMDSPCDYNRHNILFDHKALGINMKLLPDGLDVVNVKAGSIVSGIFEKLDYYAESFNQADFLSVAKLLIQEIIINISLIEKQDDGGISVINPLLSKALSYIGENLFTVKDIAEVAESAFVTESYLFRLFKKELLKSPKKYITEKRLLYAQNQLKKGKKPTEVAAACGFEDYTTFYRNYVSLFGKSPSFEKSN